jgi:hypothetical protein
MQVYGGSVRPRSYTIIEAFGCSVDGSLPDNSGLEATLKVCEKEGERRCVRGACRAIV